jgi:hypothetical protein
MTNLDAFQAVLSPISYESNVADKAMLDNDIIGADTYSKDSALSIDKAALAVLEGILSAPNISEGSFSISYDRKAVIDRINLICERSGLASSIGKPKITNKTNMW